MVTVKDMAEDDDHVVDLKKNEEGRRYRAQISKLVKTVVHFAAGWESIVLLLLVLRATLNRSRLVVFNRDGYSDKRLK